jgi:hypothetical protein
MMQFKKKNVDILNYRLLFNENNFFFFFSLNNLDSNVLFKFKNFCKLYSLIVFSLDTMRLFSKSCKGLKFLKGNYLGFCCADLKFLIDALNLSDFFFNRNFLFLFYGKFLNLNRMVDLIFFVEKFQLKYFLVYLLFSLYFYLFFFKIFFCLIDIVIKIRL